MTERRDGVAGLVAHRRGSEPVRSRAATVLFAVGLVVVAATSALYFFGVEFFSGPAVPVLGLALGLALLAPLSLRPR